MQTKQALAWVQRNKTRVDRAQSIGCKVQRLVESVLGGADAAAPDAVVVTLNAHVDDEFRCHCRVSVDGFGMLIIVVDQPPLVSVMRRKWKRRLTGALMASQNVSGVRGIVFEHGVSGRRVHPVSRQPMSPRKEGSDA